MSSPRTIALIAGVLFVLTFVTSIPAFILYGPVLNDPNYIVGAGADMQVFLGAFLEVFLVITNVGTGVVLFPILRRESEAIALGYVGSRLVESTLIAAGIISLLAVVTLRQDLVGAADADTEALVTAGRSLVALHDWTFLMGPGFGGVNDLLLGYLLYRTGLVPRWLALLGLVGGPVLFVSAAAQLLGVVEPFSTPRAIATIPVFAFEAILGIWLMLRGFSPSPILAVYERERGNVRGASSA
jgi:hypothetical protein